MSPKERPNTSASHNPFRVMSQVALVVHDIEQASSAFAQAFGLPKPKIMLTEPENVTHVKFRGVPTQARSKLAYLELENITLELIEPVGAPSTYDETLTQRGQCVHHLGFIVESIETASSSLLEKGFVVIQTGDFDGGRYAHLSPEEELGVMFELLEYDSIRFEDREGNDA